jgi:ribosomal subunit interface protein
MQIIIAGRHFTVTDALKTDINERLEAVLSNIRLKISTVRVVLDIEHTNRCTAEVIINLKNSVIEADVTTRDMYEAVDQVMDKKQDHHNEVSIKDIPVIEEETEEAYDEIYD